jgi:transposase-like protein
MNIRSYDDFKEAITRRVVGEGITRSALARRLEEDGQLRAHTVRCLLSKAPSIGRRKPAFDSILKIAHAAGFEITLTQRQETCPASPRRRSA